MPIIYSLVARGTVVLAEHTDSSGNFITVTHRLLEKIPINEDSKMSYIYDKFIFHYMVEGGITYLCLADDQFGRRIPFSFLDNIKNRFMSTYGRYCQNAMAYAFNAEFSRVLQIQMKYFSSDPGADSISQVRSQIDEVKSVMVANIEKVLERGERIELLVEQTETLQSSAFEFKKNSTKLKRAMWWKNFKITIILIIVILVIAYIAAAIGCGWRFQKCIKKAKDVISSSSTSSTSSSTIAALATLSSSLATSSSSISSSSSSTTGNVSPPTLDPSNSGGTSQNSASTTDSSTTDSSPSSPPSLSPSPLPSLSPSPPDGGDSSSTAQ